VGLQLLTAQLLTRNLHQGAHAHAVLHIQFFNLLQTCQPAPGFTHAQLQVTGPFQGHQIETRERHGSDHAATECSQRQLLPAAPQFQSAGADVHGTLGHPESILIAVLVVVVPVQGDQHGEMFGLQKIGAQQTGFCAVGAIGFGGRGQQRADLHGRFVFEIK